MSIGDLLNQFYICRPKMRNLSIYILTSIFLLLSIGSRYFVNYIYQDHFSQTTHHFQGKPAGLKFNHHKLTSEKVLNDVGDLESIIVSEDDMRFTENLQNLVVFATVFGFFILLGLHFKKRVSEEVLSEILLSSSIKKFILLRSIRI